MDIFPLETDEFNLICNYKLDLNRIVDIKLENFIDSTSVKTNYIELKDKKTSFYINKAKKVIDNDIIRFKNENQTELSKKMPISVSKTLTKEEKKERRRLKNCISARKLQIKKKKYTELLEDYVVQLENQINALQNQI